MMSLRELVDRYRALAGEFGQPVALSAFALGQTDTERLFSAYDEDYHISRFFQFTRQRGLPGKGTGGARRSRKSPTPGRATLYSINGFPATHVALDAEIASIL